MKLVMPYFIVRNCVRYSRHYYSLFAANNMVLEFYILFISLNIVYLFSLALVASFMPLVKNYYNLIKNIIRIKINILNIFLYILLLALLGFGEFLISSFMVLLNCSVAGPLFTLFIKSYFMSGDG